MPVMNSAQHLLARETITPGLDPPPGVTPNFVDPETRAPYAIIAHTIALSLATIFVAMRMYTKIWITRSPGWDDYTSLFCWVFTIAYSGLGLSQLQYGFGVHQWNVPLENTIQFLRLSNVEQILYPILTFMVKVSILLLYRRIFSPSRRMMLSIAVMLGFLFCFYLSNISVKIFQCKPRSRIWDKRVRGTCLDVHKLYLTTAVINVMSDFYILVLPLPSIWHLQVPLARKVGLMAAFSAGLFACIASIVRMAETIRHPSIPDTTWNLITIHLWAVIEIDVGIICGCLPALPSFYHHFFPRHTMASKAGYSKDSQTSRRTIPSAHLKPDEARFMQGKYVELNEVRPVDDAAPISSYSSVVVRAETPLGTIGTTRTPITNTPATADHDGGILRTIDVETSVSSGGDAGSAGSGSDGSGSSTVVGGNVVDGHSTTTTAAATMLTSEK